MSHTIPYQVDLQRQLNTEYPILMHYDTKRFYHVYALICLCT